MKTLEIIAIIGFTFATPGAHAGSRISCSDLFDGRPQLASWLSRGVELTPTDIPVESATESKLGQLERIVETYLDPAFDRLSEAMNDGELDGLLRNTNTEVAETSEIATRLVKAYMNFNLRQNLGARIPVLKRRLMSDRFQAKTKNDLNLYRATAAVTAARLAYREKEIEAKVAQIVKLDLELARRAERVKKILRQNAEEEPLSVDDLAHAASFLDGLQVTRELIVAVVANLRTHQTSANIAGIALRDSVDQTLRAVVLKGMPETGAQALVYGEFDKPLVTIRQLEILAEIENRSSKKKYVVQQADVESLGQIEGVAATTRLLWLLTKPSRELIQGRAIELLSKRRYYPESLDALRNAFKALSKKDAKRLLEVFLMNDKSSAATEAILNNALVYHYDYADYPHVESSVALARTLGEEHVATIMTGFSQRVLLGQEIYPKLRREIIEALSRIGGPKARAGLEFIASGTWADEYLKSAKPLPYETPQVREKWRREVADTTNLAEAALGIISR